ncbi:MAG: NUDIX hydrolase [Clostridia bacterium]|nr:NUDIX hydrolase [Clostridia bacterium]
MKRKELKQHLYEYLPFNEQEERDLKVIIDALASEWEKKSGRNALFALEGCGEELFVRENLAMHMTASAWVVSPDRKHVLMAYHNLYHSWAWLGGHADGEADLMEVARREVMEESGVKNVRPLMNTIFSVEILTVDGHEKRGKYVPSHLHLNVTYLFEADMDEELRVKEDENSAVGWIPVEEVAERVSEPWMMKRIYAKLMKKAEQLESMKRILLCADDEPTVFAVPDAVAEHLDDYCEEFIQWMQTSPDAERYREPLGGIFALCYGETDFIRYLNEHVFPEQRSFAVQRWIEEGLAEEYKDLPYYCF